MSSAKEFNHARYSGWYGYSVRTNNLAEAKAKFEATKPVQGTRKKHGCEIRPLAKRARVWEAWHHDEDTGSYGMAFVRSYPVHTNGDTNKTISRFEKEVSPFLMWHPDGRLVFSPKWMGSYSTWEMLAALLPEGITFVKYGAKQYFKLDTPEGKPMYMHSPEGVGLTFVPYEKEGKQYFHLSGSVTYPEQKILIDREASKRARGEAKAFFEYAEAMWGLMTADIDVDNHASLTWSVRMASEKLLDSNWLIRTEGEEIGGRWADAVEAFIKLNIRTDYRFDRASSDLKMEKVVYIPTVESIKDRLSGERLNRVAKPYRLVDVPLGEPFFDNGRTL